MNIYNINGDVWLSDVPITPSCEAVMELMKDDYVQLVWNADYNDVIPVGSYITYNGERYSLIEPYMPDQRTEKEYTYSPKFVSAYIGLAKVPFFMYTAGGGKEAEWSLTDNPANFMSALCAAILTETGLKYTYAIGNDILIASATCTFNCTSIQSAINEIAGAFETEIWLEKFSNADANGNIGCLHIGKAIHGTAVPLEVGVNIKVPSITKNGEYFNRFYVFGSARNITQDYQGANVNNLATKRLTLDPTDYPNGYIDFSNGGPVFSKVLQFDDIYPAATDLVVMNIRAWLRYRRDESTSEKIQIGTDPVTGDPVYDQYAVWFVNLKRKVNGSYVDFTFNNTTYDKDDNPNGMLLPGLVPSLHFNSGPLAGREFEVIYHDTAETVKDGSDGLSFNILAGDFEIKFIEEGTYIIPAVTGLIPTTDNLVVLFNVMMPSSYVDDAYDRLEATALDEIAKNYIDQDTLEKVDKNSYQVESDPTVFSASDPELTIGSKVNYVNGTYEKESRVTRIVKKLDYPCKQTIVFGDEIIKGNIEELKEEAVSANKNIDILAALNKTTAELTAAYERTHQLVLKQIADQASMWLVVDGTVKLNPIYSGLWADGWMAAGGIGTGGGGGGGVSYLNDLSDVSVPNPAAGDLLSWDATANSGQGAWVNVPRSQVGTPVSLSNGADYSSLTVNSVTADFYTKEQVDSLLANIDLSDYVTESALATTLSGYATVSAMNAAISGVNTLSDISTLQDGILTFEWSNGDTINVDLNHEHSDYVPLTRTINGIDLSQNRSFYVGKTAIQGTSQSQALEGILSVKETSASSLFEWEPNAGGTGVGAWRFHGNLYADGWIAAGGIGSGGGGGGSVSSVIYLNDLEDVIAPTPYTNDVLTYTSRGWVNTPKAEFLSGYLLSSQLKTVNNTSLVGPGNITISDGKSAYEIWLDEGYSGTEADFLASLQGNSGYQGAASELQVVNNYTDGGATAALSAEMGKQLYAIITALDASGYKIVGIATPSTNPSTPSYKVAYIAGAGAYPYFGDLTVGYNELALFVYSNGNWVKFSTSIKVSKQVDDLLYRIAKTNFYNPNDTDIEEGYYLDINGDLVENANYLVTGYIPFTASMGKMIPSVAGNDMSGAGGFLVLYDSDKQVVATYQENHVHGIATWEDGVSYVRFSIMGPQRGAIQVEVGTEITTYMAYGSVFISEDVTINGGSLADGTIPGEAIAAGVISPEKCTFFKSNLFNPDDEDVAEGYYLDNGGNLQSNASWLATGYIPFASGKMCASVDGTSASGGGFIVLYDRNKTRVASYQSNTVDNVATWEANVAYVRFSLYDYTRGKIQVEPGDTITDYVPYGQPILAPQYSGASPMLDSILGEDASRVVSASLTSGNSVTISNFPYHIKKGLCMSASADITTFDTIYIGKGYNQYRGDWLMINGTSIVLQHYESSVSNVESFEHGLTISTFLRVSLSSDNSGVLHVVLNTLGGVFKCEFDNFGFEANYAPFLRSGASSLTNVVLTAGNTDFKFPVWACGDSYFGVYEGRWPGWMKEFGYFNFLINGLAGQSSAGAFNDLKRMLSFGTPKYLLWCLGMNDTDSAFIEYFDKTKALCEQKGITMIGATVPTVPERDKETISAYVRASGLRYIDFYKAVGANSSGVWYSGYLDSDQVHPSVLGAKALATQVLVDFPELMQYGLTS